MADIEDDIITQISLELDIPKHEVRKVINSQFKVIEQIVTNKECKVINCIKLGKFYPTAYRRKFEDGKVKRNS